MVIGFAYLRTCGETYWRRLSFGVVKRQVEDSVADIENIRSGFLCAGPALASNTRSPIGR